MTETDLHLHDHGQNRYSVIPAAQKLGADINFTGKGVRIAFLDSGFFPHPDIAGRVHAFFDVSGVEKSFEETTAPQPHHWHGTQTVVSCAGNGKLSDGIYAGLAQHSELVLIKVSENDGSIPDQNIGKGLEWVLENHEQNGIRIVNMSFGGDRDLATGESRINQLAE